MWNRRRDLVIINLGFVLIVLGGFTHILDEAVFWYPLGVITVPFVTAWINWVVAMIKPKKKTYSVSSAPGANP